MGEHHHGHDDGDGHEHHGHVRISTPQERALLEPFTDDVHRFLRGALAGVEGTVVEVGAGDGVIADRLRADGFDVIALDANAETAAAATEQGREVLHADWRTWDGDGRAPFAALIFTRSLHHIDPIEHATDQIARLAPGGLLIADEFGYERLEAAGAQFLADARAMAAAAGMNEDEPVAVADPLQAWQHYMSVEHHVTRSDQLLDAVGKVADVEQMGNGRFLAQFITFGLDPTHPRAAAVRDLVTATEDARIAAGTLVAGGVRFIARIHG